MKRRSKPRQLALLPRAPKERRGRPRKPGMVSHARRPVLASRFPLHVTLKMTQTTWNLRSRRSMRIIEKAFWGAMTLTSARICHFSVQGNHIHMLVEAGSRDTLARAMQSLGIRLGKGMNRLMGRRGRVLAHRYHARILRSPTQVKNARRYVLGNYEKHATERGERVSRTYVDPFSSAAVPDLPRPVTWLLDVGWKRGR